MEGDILMQKQLISMLLGMLKPEMVIEIVVGILWELAKSTENKLDDKIVKIVADNLGVKVD